MFCEKCGAQMADTETFCPNCGAQQSVANAAPAAYGAPAAPAAPTFKLYDILVFVAIAVMAIGTLLPVFSASAFGQSKSLNFFSDEGVFDANGIFVLIPQSLCPPMVYSLLLLLLQLLLFTCSTKKSLWLFPQQLQLCF